MTGTRMIILQLSVIGMLFFSSAQVVEGEIHNNTYNIYS